MTLGAWLDTWEKTCLRDVKPRTVEIYQGVIRVHLKPALGAIRLEALNTPMIQEFYNNCMKRCPDGAVRQRCAHPVRENTSPKTAKSKGKTF